MIRNPKPKVTMSADVRTFLEMLARMTLDDGSDDMASDDAVEALNQVIRKSRKLLRDADTLV